MNKPHLKELDTKVSIFCLTYNHQETIDKTISSFFNQSLNDPFEIIIADDASTDETFNILTNWKKISEYIKILKFKKNVFKTEIFSQWKLFDLARGDFCAGCEGDDFWLDSRKLEIQIEALENEPDMMSCTMPGQIMIC